MSERWRRPAQIEAIEPDPGRTLTIAGRRYRNYDVTVTGETFERMVAGSMCAMCMEPLERPNPSACPVCGFRVGRDQAAWLERTYGGEQWIGATETLADEFERMDEETEMRKFKPGSQIILPAGVKLDD